MSENNIPVVLKKYITFRECIDDLNRQGCKNLGWLNSGITVPEGNYQDVYKNFSGSTTCCCDPEQKLYYLVDCGD